MSQLSKAKHPYFMHFSKKHNASQFKGEMKKSGCANRHTRSLSVNNHYKCSIKKGIPFINNPGSASSYH